MIPSELPIHSIIPELVRTLTENTQCILEAPPGAGKTTVVPLAFIGAPWLNGKKIIMLEPRRIAAKAASRRLQVGLQVGLRVGLRVGSPRSSPESSPEGLHVGYRVRGDSTVRKDSVIEVVTEGVLTRMLTADPSLSEYGLVIFDEFHERSIHADVGLGLTLLTQELERPDLRVMVMSATLSNLDLHTVMPNAAVVKSEGRSFPVETIYLNSATDRPLPTLVTAAVSDAIRDHDGDVLVFLPGQAEIRRSMEALEQRFRGTDGVELLTLYGDLSPEQQDRVLRPSERGQARRVILSTAVAETSVTIDGVRTVIDGGLSREPRFDVRSGMTQLVTVPVSQDAAEQRRGRAGRTAPGWCIRLWTEAQHANLPPRRTPEILSADLVPLLMDVTSYGASINDLPWLDVPPTAAIAQAKELLIELEAMTENGLLTDHGRAIARKGTHPRLAHMMERVKGWKGEGVKGLDGVARDVAAYLEERNRPSQRTAEIHVWNHAQEDIAVCLALAYPDRIARKKDGSRYLLRNGRTAQLAEHDPLARQEWLAVAELGGGKETWISSAVPITEAMIRELYGAQIKTERQGYWDDRSERLVAVKAERLGALTLSERPDNEADAESLARIFAQVVIDRGGRDLPWTAASEQLRDRLRFAAALKGESGSEMSVDMLAPYLIGKRKLGELGQLDMHAVLLSGLEWSAQKDLDAVAPVWYTPPSGRAVRIDYADPERPVISVRLQDMFGVTQTPSVGRGTVPLTVELLSPARRPIQVTRDLAGFWKGSYQEVRKEMRGRYPKHNWPEDPTGTDHAGKQ